MFSTGVCSSQATFRARKIRAESLLFQRGGGIKILILIAFCQLAWGFEVEAAQRWRWSNPKPHGNNIMETAYQPALGLAVQVAERGQIYTSYDFDFWMPQDSGTTNSLRAVTFFGSRILVVGESGTVLYADSPDAFRPATLPAPTTDWLEGVAASTTLAVAVGDNAAIYTTGSGTNWSRVPPANIPFTNWLRSVAYGGNRFVAVGEVGRIAESTNGTIWTTNASPTTYNLNRITYNGQYFTIVGDSGVVLTNSGSTWQLLTGSGASSNLYASAGTATGAQLLAGDYEMRLREAGIWRNVLDPTNTFRPPSWTYLHALTLTNQSGSNQLASFFVTGRTGMMVSGYRTNGTYLWDVAGSSLRNWLWDVTFVNNLYATVGDYATIMTSLDGVTWDLEAPPPMHTNRVYLGVGGDTNVLLAVGTGGAIALSTNGVVTVVTTNGSGTNVVITTNYVNSYGIFWRAAGSTPTTNTLQGVAAFNGQYIVVGDYGTILRSINGAIWSVVTSPTNLILTSVAASQSGWVAVGEKGALFYSANGTAWTRINSQTTNWLYRVRYLSGRYVVVGQKGVFLTSTNGQNWSLPVTISSSWLNDVAYVGGAYYAIGSQGTVLMSTNLVDWASLGTITGKSLYGAATDGGQLILVGVEGAILRSQIIPIETPVRIGSFDTTLTSNLVQQLFLFEGRPDQRFVLQSSSDLFNWTTEASLELFDSSGTVYYYKSVARTNAPVHRFYRTKLIP